MTMKLLLTTTVAFAALAVSVPALADEVEGAPTSTQSTTFTVNGQTPAKCKINADNTLVTLDRDLTNDQGRARANIGDRVAQGLNVLGVRAWCTGANNQVSLGRTSLKLTESDGSPLDGFNRAIIYDLLLTIDGATRNDGGNQEGSEDGLDSAGNPRFGHFGPTGPGALVRFTDGFTSSEATTSSASGSIARSNFPGSNARLIAGSYSGTVTLQIAPSL